MKPLVIVTPTGERPKNPFKSDSLKARIEGFIQSRKDMVFYLLLCPCYPNNGENFTYAEGKMTIGEPPNLSRFLDKLGQNIRYLHFRGFPLERVRAQSLVCDIENDIPSVVRRFANGREDFMEIVAKTAIHLESVFRDFTKDTPIRIESSTFTQYLDGLPAYQRHYEKLSEELTLPREFHGQLYDRL